MCIQPQQLEVSTFGHKNERNVEMAATKMKSTGVLNPRCWYTQCATTVQICWFMEYDY